jgi:hypothetical protein
MPDLRRHRLEMLICKCLNDDTDQTAAALIHNSLQRILQFVLGIFRHPVQFILDAFPYQIMQGFAENIGTPDLGGIFFKLIQHVTHQFLTLFSVPMIGVISVVISA